MHVLGMVRGVYHDNSHVEAGHHSVRGVRQQT